MGIATCAALFAKERHATFGAKVDLRRFEDLPEPGRLLILGWWKRSAASESPFERFIYLWISFNGWASCVTGLDNDRDWLDALALNKDLAERFAFVSGTDPKLGSAISAWRDFWPLFRFRELERVNVAHLATHSRGELVRQFLGAGARPAAPECWEEHKDASCPADWPHVLSTLYRVRCNLFHGCKTLHSEIDNAVVIAAAAVLAQSIEAMSILTNPATDEAM